MSKDATLDDEPVNQAETNDVAKAAQTLSYVAALFIIGSGRFSDEDVDLFDDIMQRLVDRVESSAKAILSRELAAVSDAPKKVLSVLARDENIEVAGPILSRSERLEQADILHGAKTGSQAHLLAITERKMLSPEVTDILLERGDSHVVRSAASNIGAEFSQAGYSKLVQKSRHDEELALGVWCRPGVPRAILARIFKDASAPLQRLFEEREPKNAVIIQNAIADASSQLLAMSRMESAGYPTAQSDVKALQVRGVLNESHLMNFAMSDDFDRTSITLSLLSGLPINLIERAFIQHRMEPLLVILKAIGTSWETAKRVISLGTEPTAISNKEMENSLAIFNQLQAKTAKAAIKFYCERELASR